MRGFAKSIRRILRVAKCNLLDEFKNDITREPPARPVRDFEAGFIGLAYPLSHGASFEPSIDYVVTKVRRRDAATALAI